MLFRSDRDADFVRLHDASFAASPQTSVDYAIMEKTSKVCVLPVDYRWSDIGSWDAVAAALPLDDLGNSIVGEVVLEQSSGVVVHSQGILTAVVGCSDIVVVTTKDAVLVAKRGQTEAVKLLVDQLNSDGLGYYI